MIRTLDGAGIRIADIGLRRPTLDDVFLSLTGRAADNPDTDNPDTDTAVTDTDEAAGRPAGRKKARA